MAGICCGIRVLLFLVAFGLSSIHSFVDDDGSPLIEMQCGDFKYVNVDFGGDDVESKYKLSNSKCGQEVQLDKVNADEAPTVTFKDAVKGTKYLIAMVDPDAPYADNPICKSWLHWIVGNIDGEHLATGDTSSGDTFTDYKPPTPPPPKPGKINEHRYFIYVSQQEQDLDNKAEVAERCHFDIDNYNNKFGLNIVAMNMFKTHS